MTCRMLVPVDHRLHLIWADPTRFAETPPFACACPPDLGQYRHFQCNSTCCTATPPIALHLHLLPLDSPPFLVSHFCCCRARTCQISLELCVSTGFVTKFLPILTCPGTTETKIWHQKEWGVYGRRCRRNAIGGVAVNPVGSAQIRWRRWSTGTSMRHAIPVSRTCRVLLYYFINS